MLLAACSGGSSSDAGSGVLIATSSDGALRAFSLDARTWSTAVQPPQNGAVLLFPAVSPDGSRIAYAVQPPLPTEGGVADAGFDLWVAGRDGSAPRRVFEHVAVNQQVTTPQWLDDQTVLALVQEATPRGIVLVLERFDATTGERAPLIENVLAFTIAPGGHRLALVEYRDDGLALSLANVDGSARETLLSAEDGLSPFNAPRFSPDGGTLVFGSAELLRSASRVRYVAFGPPRDGAPQDLWSVDVAGGRPRRLAPLKEDSPWLAWGGDGEHVYAMGTYGLYALKVKTGAVERLGDGLFHGQIAWAPR